LPQALSSFDDISHVKNGLLFCLPISREFNLLFCGLRPTGDKNTYEFWCFDGASDWVAQYAGRRVQFDYDGIYDPAHPILIEFHFSLCCYFEKAPRYWIPCGSWICFVSFLHYSFLLKCWSDFAPVLLVTHP
jgi:hypothetical protein